VRAQVAFNRPLSAAYRYLGVAVPDFPGTIGPGQFVMVRPPLVADPLLPRAFSIYRISQAEGGTPVVEILYKIMGKGTHYLAQMDPGQALEILGPLGNSFTAPDAGLAVLVAGGIGVPPIAALARQLHTPHSRLGRLEVFLGGKTSDDILCLNDFEAVGASVHITTEDESLGTRGLVTDLLEPLLLTPHRSPLTIFTCGPPGMLSAVGRMAEKYGVPCQASVEANMACGFGACMGCAIEVRSNGSGPAYKLVCKDGPVFDSRELVWKS
jgi:dihydroorotate dehydrogenase electron transfer subunit